MICALWPLFVGFASLTDLASVGLTLKFSTSTGSLVGSAGRIGSRNLFCEGGALMPAEGGGGPSPPSSGGGGGPFPPSFARPPDAGLHWVSTKVSEQVWVITVVIAT